jgi:predicted transcriptional regulator
MSTLLNLVANSNGASSYRAPSDLSLQLNHSVGVSPTTRGDVQYNHVRTAVKLYSKLRVSNPCGNNCTDVIGVVTVSWSGPEGLDPSVFWTAVNNYINTQLNGNIGFPANALQSEITLPITKGSDGTYTVDA